MLYAITYSFNDDLEKHQDFFNELMAMGEIDCPFDGCALLYSVLTAYGIRKRILPFFRNQEHVCISKLYREHAAGKLPDHSKKFIASYIPNDPSRNSA